MIAAHKFSMGAERLEAARNDAEAEKTSSARNRESVGFLVLLLH